MSSYFVVTSPGLEQLAAQELVRLELTPKIEPGGVSFSSDELGMYRVNLHLRTASRVLARVGQFFYATAFSELREKAGRLPWERFIKPGQTVDIRVTCHKSKLMHTDAVAERIAGAIYDRLGKESPVLKTTDEASGTESRPIAGAVQLIVVRIV